MLGRWSFGRGDGMGGLAFGVGLFERLWRGVRGWLAFVPLRLALRYILEGS